MEAREAAAIARHVVKVLGASGLYRDKGHFSIEGDRSLSVRLEDGTYVLVQQWDGQVTCFRPGYWCQHLLNLGADADRLIEEREGHRQAVYQAEQAIRFGPVDDAALFPQYAGKEA